MNNNKKQAQYTLAGKKNIPYTPYPIISVDLRGNNLMPNKYIIIDNAPMILLK
jgi:hypothetical protein